jgi:hypothetical protein
VKNNFYQPVEVEIKMTLKNACIKMKNKSGLRVVCLGVMLVMTVYRMIMTNWRKLIKLVIMKVMKDLGTMLIYAE